MPIETNVICEQCGNYADRQTYIRLAAIDNRRDIPDPTNLVYIVPPHTFDVVFCSFKCTKEFLNTINK